MPTTNKPVSFLFYSFFFLFYSLPFSPLVFFLRFPSTVYRCQTFHVFFIFSDILLLLIFFFFLIGQRDRVGTVDDDDFSGDFSDDQDDEYLPDEFDDMNTGGGEIELGSTSSSAKEKNSKNDDDDDDKDEFSLGYRDEYDEDDDDIMA